MSHLCELNGDGVATEANAVHLMVSSLSRFKSMSQEGMSALPPGHSRVRRCDTHCCVSWVFKLDESITVVRMGGMLMKRLADE